MSLLLVEKRLYVCVCVCLLVKLGSLTECTVERAIVPSVGEDALLEYEHLLQTYHKV